MTQGHCYISMDENKKGGPGGVIGSVYTEYLHICTGAILLGAAKLSRFYNLKQFFFSSSSYLVHMYSKSGT